MPDGVLDYSSHEHMPSGFRLETDGPVTRLYILHARSWWKVVDIVGCFSVSALCAAVVSAFLFVTPPSYRRQPDLREAFWEFVVGGFLWFTLGLSKVLWQRRWGRTPTIIEASPKGLTSRRPFIWRLRTRFTPREKITQIKIWRPTRISRISLRVVATSKWRPRIIFLRTRNMADAQRVRDALAAALGLP